MPTAQHLCGRAGRKAQGVDKLIRHLLYLVEKRPRGKALITVLKYFRNKRKRMAYAEALAT